MLRDSLRRPAIWILGFAFAYWSRLIFLQSRVLDGKRYFVLFDDAMISMRYAANAARGSGLVFNVGERIEGFTNPLWTAMMVLVHFLVADRALTSLAVQIVSAVLLAGAVLQSGRLALVLSGNPTARWLSMISCATFYPLVFWSLRGMEVSALAFLSTWAVAQATEAQKAGKFSLGAFAILAIAMLVRIDMVVIAGTLLVVSTALTRDWRSSAAALSILFISALGQTMARLAYYGELLPNTYYLKMGGISWWRRVSYGVQVFDDWMGQSHYLPLLPVLAPFVRRSRLLAPAVAVVVAEAAYSVWIGGDAFEGHQIGANRFLSTVAPIALVLLVFVCVTVADRSRAAAGAAVACALVLANGILGIDRARTVAGVDRDGDALASLHWTRQALALERVAPANARIAVVAAGTVPYFLLDHYVIDILGKMDKRIAHLPMHQISSAREWQPGHMKYDQSYSIGELKPDIIAGYWKADEFIARNYLWNEATGSFFRSNAREVGPRGNRPP